MLENKYWKRHKKLCSSAAAKSLLHKIRILVRSDKVFHAAHPRFIPTTFFPRDRVSADVFQNNEVLRWLLEVAYPLLEQSEKDPWNKVTPNPILVFLRKIEEIEKKVVGNLRKKCGKSQCVARVILVHKE